MNIETIRYFHLNGVISGVFLSIAVMVGFFVIVFLLKKRQTSLFSTMTLCTLCFFCFWFFNIYFQLLLFPMESLYPEWIFKILKVSLPIGLIIFTGLFIKMSVLRSEASYMAYKQLKPFVQVLIGFCLVAAFVFVFLTDHHLIIGITELLLMYASFIGTMYSYKAIQPVLLGRIMSVVLSIGCISFASIAFIIFFFEDTSHLLFILTFESFVLSLMMICICFYILIYGYHELTNFSDHDSYDWRNLLSSIHTAVEKNQFKLVYQPKINLKDNTITGLEALLRWEHPERGVISPAEFIPLSEKSYLIDTICAWVIETAIKQASEFSKQGVKISISINFSVKNLHPKMVTLLIETLKKYNVNPKMIYVEITESIFMKQTDVEIKALEMLMESGVGLSLDDYGTGYSSLEIMNTLDIDELKIDRSFISDIIDNKQHCIIVESTVFMTKQLGMSIVAEGAEDDAVIAKLGDLGCEVVQGYGVAKPMPIEKFNDWVAASAYKLQ